MCSRGMISTEYSKVQRGHLNASKTQLTSDMAFTY